MTQSTQSTILFIAGDVSGDLNSAKLAKLLLERNPGWTLHAVGGPYLGAEVVKSPGGRWLDNTGNLSAIGIYAAAGLYLRARAISQRMRKFVRANKIDAVVLCDWGAFNCGQFKFFKEAGVPVFYYFPPGSWRRTGRGGLNIVPWVKRVATPFEWSAQRLVAAGCNAEWVAHPMLETKYTAEQRASLRREFGVAENEKLVALLPGSRPQEISCLGPKLEKVAEILRQKGGVRFVVASPHSRVDAVRKYFPEFVKIVSERTADVFCACDAAVVKSGTGTLEAAVTGAPQVVVYDVNWVGRIEWTLLWMWKKIPFIGMPNVILQRMAVPELIGLECTPEKVAGAVTQLLEDEAKRRQIAGDYQEIRERLGAALPEPGTQRTAEMLEEMLREESPS